MDASSLLIDMLGKIHSEWNCQVMEILGGRLKDQAALENLPLCSEAYIVRLVQDRIQRLRQIWQDVQPKVYETGFIETTAELEDRLVQKKGKNGKAMRHLSRRMAVSKIENLWDPEDLHEG